MIYYLIKFIFRYIFVHTHLIISIWLYINFSENKIIWTYYFVIYFYQRVNSNGIWTHSHLVCKLTLKHLSQTGQMIELCWKYLSVQCIWLYLIIMSHTSFRVNLHSIVCLNVKELLAWSRHQIWSLSGSNRIQTHNHLICQQTLNHLAKLAKCLSCVVSTYLHGAFDYMLLSCHIQVSM